MNLAETRTVESLTDHELRALLAAATWYAKYHEHMIEEEADDRSAAAVVRREEFMDLHAALGKMGIRLRPPVRAPLPA